MTDTPTPTPTPTPSPTDGFTAKNFALISGVTGGVATIVIGGWIWMKLIGAGVLTAHGWTSWWHYYAAWATFPFLSVLFIFISLFYGNKLLPGGIQWNNLMG